MIKLNLIFFYKINVSNNTDFTMSSEESMNYICIFSNHFFKETIFMQLHLSPNHFCKKILKYKLTQVNFED